MIERNVMYSNLLVIFILIQLYPTTAALQNYDPEFARFIFDHAAAAYSGDPSKCLTKFYGTEVLRQRNISCDHLHNECLYYISQSPKYIVVAFGGTHSKLQLTVEILTSMTEPKAKFLAGGSVQHYFNAAFKSLWKDMRNALRRSLKKNMLANATRPVVFTGHSLGASLASIASAHFAYLNAKIAPNIDVRLITFGEPRTGNGEYAFVHDTLVPVSFRVVHRADLVPHLPSCLVSLRTLACSSRLNFGPYHHGIEIWYPENMTKTSPYTICINKPRNEDQTCSNGYRCRYTINDHLYYFGEHVSEYGRAGCTTSENVDRKNLQ